MSDDDFSFIKIDGTIIPGKNSVLIKMFNDIEGKIAKLQPGERVRYVVDTVRKDGKGNIVVVSLHHGSDIHLDLIDDGSDEYRQLLSGI